MDDERIAQRTVPLRLGRQREWEGTPQARLGGRTPKQAPIDARKKAAKRVAGEA